ncbi:MAG: hypothetical protein FH759_05270 [Sediminimonas qiaohouensis]|uniref:Uncharacterized protein n=1 Tax=Sediminimonas qiaohouensis TaxID=552061 RepID=A0A7C9HA85_9RHOB|nr:hypothetical protein [Sediminimonas qiaohouensis]MTJ04091.1 hypothetical protein [Sediminimonas qiaohouensis]
MNMRWIVRMARWARHPPSEKMVKLVLSIVAVAAVIYVIERYVGWPDWMSLDNTRGRLTPR